MLIDEIRGGESPTLELKRDIPGQALKYLKTVSAFANGKGGRIVFGVDTDLSIVGMAEPFSARDRTLAGRKAEHWRGKAEHWRGKAEHWRRKSEHWRGKAEH